MAIISLLFAAAVYVGFWLFRQKQYTIAFFSLLLLAALFTVSLLYIPGISKRYEEISQTAWEPPVGVAHNSTNLRIGQWTCSLKVIREHLVLGTGTGDGQWALNNCYENEGYSDVLYLLNYNSHNQYLQSLLYNGIGAFLALICMLGYALTFSKKNDDLLLGGFIIVVASHFMTESLLATQKGIVFYSFFLSFFIFSNRQKNV